MIGCEGTDDHSPQHMSEYPLQPPPEPESAFGVLSASCDRRQHRGGGARRRRADLTGLFKFKFALSFLLPGVIYSLAGWCSCCWCTRWARHPAAEGLSASAPTFIPFMGAMVAMRDMPSGRGGAGVGRPDPGQRRALAVRDLGGKERWTRKPAASAGLTGLLLNLFNLVPRRPPRRVRGRPHCTCSGSLGLFTEIALLAFHYRTLLLHRAGLRGLRGVPTVAGPHDPAARAYHEARYRLQRLHRARWWRSLFDYFACQRLSGAAVGEAPVEQRGGACCLPWACRHTRVRVVLPGRPPPRRHWPAAVVDPLLIPSRQVG